MSYYNETKSDDYDCLSSEIMDVNDWLLFFADKNFVTVRFLSRYVGFHCEEFENF